MRKIVLCVDNGNSYMEEIKNYLSSHDCKVYTLPEKETDIKTLLAEIEQKEGSVDLLVLVRTSGYLKMAPSVWNVIMTGFWSCWENR